ncbi:ParB/RepB/Spo0J family partition protein [Agromyces sp. NPDC058126]|uniref:ParB/RepB/Spo0J family partition protein n=1 Tax=Agromyces sp. NPDC058126 TaxID=3346350 RepID=UPI0036DDC80F
MSKTKTHAMHDADTDNSQVTPSIEWIDTAAAELDANIRTTPDTTTEAWAAWVVQLREEGVETPLLARRGDDGTVYVWDGQRRLLGAREAGIGRVLAIFGTTPGEDTERIIGQLKTFNRADLPELDRVLAYEQLAFAGIDVETIARRTGDTPERVTQAVTLAKSDAAKDAVAAQVSFERALVVAEFDGDENAVARILACTDDDELAWVAQHIRDDRATRAHRDRVLAGYAEQGVAVFTDRHAREGEFTRLHMLTDAAEDATERPALSADAHQSCEGHALVVLVWGADEDEIDREHVCTRPEAHQPRFPQYGTVSVAGQSKTAEQVEAEQEAKRDARRRVIANNKAWKAATPVREEWVQALLARKALPKGAAAFIATTLTEHQHDVNAYTDKAGHLLGLDGYDMGTRLATLVKNTPMKAGHVNLAVALAVGENRTADKHQPGWRYPSALSAHYLRQLETWGYRLTDTERLAAGYVNPDDDGDDLPDAA